MACIPHSRSLIDNVIEQALNEQRLIGAVVLVAVMVN